MSTRDRRTSQPISAEDLDAQINDLLDRMQEAGREANELARQEAIARRAVPSRSRYRDEALRTVRSYLSDELPVIARLDKQTEIDPWEEQQEIAKRALARLKAARLRDIADLVGVPRSGSREVLLDRIVRRVQADEAEIGRLVALHEDEPHPARRHTSRLFPVRRPLDAVELANQLERLSEHYLRVGIAQWVIFDRVVAAGDSMLVAATYRTYDVEPFSPDQEVDFQLKADRRDIATSAVLRDRTEFVESRAAGVTESRALIRAIGIATGLQPARDPVTPAAPIWDETQLDAGTLVVLDLLNTTFRSAMLQVRNLTMAGFEMATARAPGDDSVANRPQVKSVRFHGQHILDSRPACELITANERLSQFSAIGEYTLERGRTVLVPIRVSLEADHAAVVTGFGANDPAVSAPLQRLLTAEVGRRLVHGPVDPHGLRTLVRQIFERAREQEEPVEATMFAEAEDGTAEGSV